MRMRTSALINTFAHIYSSTLKANKQAIISGNLNIHENITGYNLKPRILVSLTKISVFIRKNLESNRIDSIIELFRLIAVNFLMNWSYQTAIKRNTSVKHKISARVIYITYKHNYFFFAGSFQSTMKSTYPHDSILLLTETINPVA